MDAFISTIHIHTIELFCMHVQTVLFGSIFACTDGYQNWAFRAMMWNEFHQQTFDSGRFTCSFPSLEGGTISGTLVLEYYGYNGGQLGAYAGYMIAIVMGYRLLAWLAVMLRK